MNNIPVIQFTSIVDFASQLSKAAALDASRIDLYHELLMETEALQFDLMLERPISIITAIFSAPGGQAVASLTVAQGRRFQTFHGKPLYDEDTNTPEKLAGQEACHQQVLDHVAEAIRVESLDTLSAEFYRGTCLVPRDMKRLLANWVPAEEGAERP